MKINKQIIAVAALALCAYNAQAFKYTVSIDSSTDPLGTGPDNSVYLPGQTGQTDFNFTLGQTGGAGSTTPWSDTTITTGVYQILSGSPSGAFSSVTLDPSTDLTTGSGVTYTEQANDGNGYDVVVDWTISPTAPNEAATLSFEFAVLTPTGFGASNSGSTIIAQQTENIDIVPIVTVPEPAQTVAGAMLLGCGGLVFAGRRLFKKQTV